VSLDSSLLVQPSREKRYRANRSEIDFKGQGSVLEG
jgi:hypothetical protein